MRPPPGIKASNDNLTYPITLEYWSTCEVTLFGGRKGGLIPFDGTDYEGWKRTSTMELKASPTMDGVTFGKIELTVILQPKAPAAPVTPVRRLRSLDGIRRDADSNSPGPGHSRDTAETVATSTTSWQLVVFMFGAVNVACD